MRRFTKKGLRTQNHVDISLKTYVIVKSMMFLKRLVSCQSSLYFHGQSIVLVKELLTEQTL